MNAENRTERVVKLLLETFPEYPRTESRSVSLSPEKLTAPEAPLLVAFARDPFEHGIRELSSPLSE